MVEDTQVIVVGIPYPHFRDLKVSEKRKYQDQRSAGSSSGAAAGSGGSSGSSPKYLTGTEWYSQQAYRALNQVCVCV